MLPIVVPADSDATSVVNRIVDAPMLPLADKFKVPAVIVPPVRTIALVQVRFAVLLAMRLPAMVMLELPPVALSMTVGATISAADVPTEPLAVRLKTEPDEIASSVTPSVS